MSKLELFKLKLKVISFIQVVLLYNIFSYAPASVQNLNGAFASSLAMFLFLVFTVVIVSQILDIFIVSDGVAGAKRIAFAEGKLINMQYSTIRVGNQPLFKVTAYYLGINKYFDQVSPAIQMNFKIGDKIVIKYDQDKPENSEIDLAESLKARNKRSSAVDSLSAIFKVERVTPDKPSISMLYDIEGYVYADGRNVDAVTIKQRLSNAQKAKVAAGKVFDCNISIKDGSESISLIVK